VDLKEAAEILGSTTEALRKRAKRGTLDSETGDDGKVYVWVDDRVDGRVDDDADRVDDRVDGGDDRHRDELISYMASEIEHLRSQLREAHEANRENRRIIAGLVQRVPELEPAREAPPEPREEPETTFPKMEVVETPIAEEKPVSWWRKLFSG